MAIQEIECDSASKTTKTIAIWKSTKEKLDKNRAPGQCYNEFICQLIDLWEEVKKESIKSINSRAGPAGGNQGAEVCSEPFA